MSVELRRRLDRYIDQHLQRQRVAELAGAPREEGENGRELLVRQDERRRVARALAAQGAWQAASWVRAMSDSETE